MTEEQITKAFEGRWRIKGNFGQINSKSATMSFDEFYGYIKDLCRNFFTAGITIGEKSVSDGSPFGNENQIQINVEQIPAIISDNDGFDAWWDKYDKKRGREKCLAKWNKLTHVEQYLCLLNTPAYVASTPDKQYRKDPLTFLNGKCWNDEIIQRNGKPTENPEQKLAAVLAP